MPLGLVFNGLQASISAGFHQHSEMSETEANLSCSLPEKSEYWTYDPVFSFFPQRGAGSWSLIPIMCAVPVGMTKVTGCHKFSYPF